MESNFKSPKAPEPEPGSKPIAKANLQTLPLAEVEKILGSSADGLTQAEAQKRLTQYGPNEIEEKKTNELLKFLSYFWGPIPWMIEAAVILSAVAQHWPDFGIILVLLLANAVVGFWEEHQAGNAIAALKATLAIKARVKREGKWVMPAARELVPGDVIRVRMGDIVPADGRLLEGDPIEVDQSALTGESLPATRKSGEAIFSGSIVRQGEIGALVYATGTNTYFGKTAELVQGAQSVSHFQRAVLKIGNYLIILAVVLVATIIAFAIFRGDPILTTLQFALVLTVAAIPVAMPTVLSVTMAVGARLLARKKAIVTRLVAIEELAGVDVLCADKTGTLTQNKLTLGDPFSVNKIPAEQVILNAALASRADNNDTIDLAVLGGLKNDQALEGYKVAHFQPFDPVHKRTEATVTGKDGKVFKVTKGAPQVILALSTNVGEVKSAVNKAVNEFAARGFRSLGVARAAAGDQWQFLGVLPLFDPPREDAKATIATARQMGVKVTMVTGDALAIAQETAKKLGMGTNILDASGFGDTKVHETAQLAESIEKADGFAQVFPEHKFHIVDVLQKSGHIVGMTGDGVNDAPALKKADCGIAVSSATDAARAAAAIVLMTPGLSVIIDAIKESRRIFQRMNSYAIYRIAETLRVLLFMTLAILVFNFYPLTAVMIVMLALLNDGAILSIAYDNVHYKDQPEAWNMPVVLGIATVLGIIGVVSAFGLFYLGERVFHLDRAHIQSLMYLKLSVAGHLTIFLTRTRGPFWSIRPARILWIAVLGTQIVATLIAVYGVFMTPLGWGWAGFVWGYALAWFLVNDRVKLLAYRIFDPVRAAPQIKAKAELNPEAKPIWSGTMNENPTVVPQRRWSAHEKGSTTGMHPSSRHLLKPIIVAVILLLAVLVGVTGVTGYLEKWLWMRQLDYTGIFWTLLSVQWVMFCSAFVVAFMFLWFNLRQAGENSAALSKDGQAWRLDLPSNSLLSRADADTQPSIELSPSLVKAAVVLTSAGVALFFATGFYGEWDTYLRFRYGGSFGVFDPLFGVDVGFYLFHLPFYVMLQSSLTLLTILTLVIVLAAYVFLGLQRASVSGRIAIGGNAMSHLSVLLFILVANFGWGFYLNHYELVYSTLGVVYGAGYAADHVTQVALWIMVGASGLACVLLAFNFFRPRLKMLTVGAGVYVAMWIIGVSVVPRIFQKFVVQPSELALETPYLKNYIDFTRKAYQLNAIQETSYPALADLTPEVLARNQDTVQNIRLWDSRPLLQTYQQTQAIRLYYQFYNVDTDRYHLADGYHQVMLSTRELSPELPAKAQTWVNQYLQFTHGYGVVMNFVSKKVGGGFPQYLLENVPAESAFGLTITQPAIYYGQSMPGYRIVHTGIKEFDYPKGNDNVYTSYNGKGGIPLDSFWKPLLFAWTKTDVNILLTSYLKPESRIQIHRDVRERVEQIAPFLRLDNDPYAVLSEGNLYWIQDAYTVSNYFPYANPERTTQSETALGQRLLGAETMGRAQDTDAGGTEERATAAFDGLNYIRNSVKVVVDMYDGTVRFYVMDPEDPVLAVYRVAFPGVFNDLGELSADLKKHLRYPEDLFTVQADQYRTFHMTDPQVFYNREDLWTAPMEKYAGQARPMEPYYILTKLPGSDQLEYLLMTPFTPQNRDNMISWMAARSDFPEYGKMLFYELPKEKLIYGPNQVEAMIDQNTTISQQLTLWNQQGSRVIRGKQIVTPIENSFLYVVPLYLRAEGTNFPQLKRVIAVAGDKVVMESTLDEALTALFGMQQPQVEPAAQTTGAATKATAGQLDAAQARMQFEDAQKAMQQGDWDKFGKAMEALKHLLANPAL